jgi:hypothetical protein
VKEDRMDYRWLSDDEIVELVNPALQSQGFSQLNVNPSQPTCRVMGAFWDDQLVEAFAFQFYPVLGPLVKVDNTFRDNGDTSRTLAAKMAEYFDEVQARGALCIADSPVTERFCQRFGMQPITNPVFEFVRR